MATVGVVQRADCEGSRVSHLAASGSRVHARMAATTAGAATTALQPQLCNHANRLHALAPAARAAVHSVMS